MNTDTKFRTILSPEADAMFDALETDDRETLIDFVFNTLPNIVRRDALVKATTPVGTLFVFQIPGTTMIVTCFDGHDQNGGRVMIVAGAAKLA